MNIYHILYQTPALEKDEMYIEQEELANRIVQSGRLRIDAIDKCNFARCYMPEVNFSAMFSYRELNDTKLLPITKKFIQTAFSRKYYGHELEKNIKKELDRLNREIKKFHPVSQELELKIARLLVQTAHPSVILLMIFESVEIFVSYSYNIGDVMDIVAWQKWGANSGMQSSFGRAYTIFVSAGGDPFGEEQKEAIYGDGFPAIARLMVIAAQEIGHYSEIIRDNMGRPVSRHAADSAGSRAKPEVLFARRSDIVNLDKLRAKLNKIGLSALAELERHLKFYKKNKRRGLLVLYTYLKSRIYRFIFINRVKKFLPNFIKETANDKYIASKIVALFDDMRFNMEPKADVYKSDNKAGEEAIACLEALARVPQQRVKWGDELTRLLMPMLYNIYYLKVIPNCIKSFETLSGVPYSLNEMHRPFSFGRVFRGLFKKRKRRYKVWEF